MIPKDDRRAILEAAYRVGSRQVGCCPERLGQRLDPPLEPAHVLFELAVDEEAAVAISANAVGVFDEDQVERRRRVPAVTPPGCGPGDGVPVEERLADAVDIPERLDVELVLVEPAAPRLRPERVRDPR